MVVIEKRMLDILVCPDNKTPLSPADEQLLARLNRAISAGQIENRGGHPVDEPLQDGLVRQDKTLLYPIIDEIPVLLTDEAIPLEQVE